MFFGLINWDKNKGDKKESSNRIKIPKNKESEISSLLESFKVDLDSKNLKLRKDLHQLTKYFNSVPFMFCIIDNDGHFLRVNKSLAYAVSVDSEQLVGKLFTEYLHPDDIDESVKLHKECIENVNHKHKLINRYIGKNGKVTYIKWGFVHLPEDKMIIAFGQDISHEIELSDELKKFITYKNLVLDNYPGAVFSTNLNGVIKEFNRNAELTTGYNKRFIVNRKHVFDIFPNKDLFKEEYLGEIKNVKLRRFDNQLIDVYLLLQPLQDENNRIVGYFGIWYGDDYVNYMRKALGNK